MHVHVEPVVLYVDIVIDGVDDGICRGAWREILVGEDQKALGIKKLELLKGVTSTTRVFLETDVSVEGVRSYLCDKIAAWFNRETELKARRSRSQDRLVVHLEKQPQPVAA